MPAGEPGLSGGVKGGTPPPGAEGWGGRRGLRILLTCEHGGNRVPPRYTPLFRGSRALLASHRGWDPGALDLARFLASGLDVPLRFSRTTRLLVDPNRSLGSPTLFSEFTRDLPAGERSRILRRYYHRHRKGVERLVHGLAAGGATVLHLAVHTFTPLWEGIEREVDLGVLFDPRRPLEAEFAEAWCRRLRRSLPALRVRKNAPYRGRDDGLTTDLREGIPAGRYLGIEVELSQGIAAESDRRAPVFTALLKTLRETVEG